MPVHESPESASPSITRAVAASLTGLPFRALELPGWQRAGLAVADRLAPSMLPRLVRWENRRRALPLPAAEQVSVEQLAADRVADYSAWEGTSSIILVGSALGGAAAYLAAALGAPFLPEPFILGFRGGTPDDQLGPHFKRAQQLAEVVAKHNPDTSLISHFDPIHDGWLTAYINHLRLKPNYLPQPYRQFINRHLAPGGTLLHLDCMAEWLAFPLAENHHYQIGGWGGIPPLEFLEGSDRIDRFLAQSGSVHRGGWRVPGVEPIWCRESEWGAGIEFGGSLQAWASAQGFRYQPLSLPTPHHYSALIFEAYQRLYRKHQRAPQGVFVGMFNQYDPATVLASHLLPLWLVFNTSDSLQLLQVMSSRFPEVPVAFAALVTYSQTPDMVPWRQWERALTGLDWYSIGARPQRYPQDTISLWRWQQRLAARMAKRPGEPVLLELSDLELVMEKFKGRQDRIPMAPLG